MHCGLLELLDNAIFDDNKGEMTAQFSLVEKSLQ
jgi:hypothetical protein